MTKQLPRAMQVGGATLGTVASITAPSDQHHPLSAPSGPSCGCGFEVEHAGQGLLPASEVPPARVNLTDRELEIARIIAQGKTNAEIAADLFLAPGTVKNHLASIQRKLGVRNRVGIAVWAWGSGLASDHAT